MTVSGIAVVILGAEWLGWGSPVDSGCRTR